MQMNVHHTIMPIEHSAETLIVLKKQKKVLSTVDVAPGYWKIKIIDYLLVWSQKKIFLHIFCTVGTTVYKHCTQH